MRFPPLALVGLSSLIAAPAAPAQAPRPGARPPASEAQVPSRPAPAETPALPKADPSQVGTSTETKPVVDLTHRYRFVERYTARDEEAGPGQVGAYHVAIQEVLRDTIEGPDGAGKSVETGRRTLYAERPSEVSGVGAATATIRRYESYEVRPDEPARPGRPRPLDGLTIWYRPQVNEPPLILSLAPDRRLREREYEVAARQVFVPSLTALLPIYPVRVGDSWRVPHRAVQAMLGEPDLKGDQLVGRFAELRREADGRTTQAVLAIAGRIANPFADTMVNAQVLFAFATPEADAAADPGSPRPRDESLIEARGSILELRLTRESRGVLPGATPAARPQKYRASQEMVLERKPGLGPATGPLPRPSTPPAPSESNTWLTHDDPRDRFAFQHPQDLLPSDRLQLGLKAGSGAIYLAKTRPEGRDLVRFEFSAKDQAPEALKDLLTAQWKQAQAEVLPGDEGWLPAADWPSGVKVYRVEAALQVANRGPRTPRVHYDAYLVKLGPDASLIVVATTTRDAVLAFRRDVEAMIRTVRLEASGGG